jgi:cation diffusion facilitator CzcD-associated flavoprotein CzcO
MKNEMLKSDGFASNLYDPETSFTLRHFCKQEGIPYDDTNLLIPREVFVAYGLEFQRRFVPTLETTNIVRVRQINSHFELTTAEGELLQARKVIVAAGITHFGYLPPVFDGLPSQFVSHSLDVNDVAEFSGKTVAVIGRGASAVDLAALLHAANAKVDMITRGDGPVFYQRTDEPRPVLQKIRSPRSGLGLGWKSRLFTSAPLAFYRMPERWRHRTVQHHLGPASTWYLRDRILGKVALHLHSQVQSAQVEGEKVHLGLVDKDGRETDLTVDHIISATGFRVALSRLAFLDEPLRSSIRSTDDSPVLSTTFESSIRGLYFVGLASANSFGPLTRFACGAAFTAGVLRNSLKKSL